MSQFEPTLPPPGVPVPKTSALAVMSLVCSLFFCCPLSTIPGILLGIGALVSIGSDPMRRGKGVAITGIVLGVVFTVGHAIFYPPAVRIGIDMIALMNSGPSQAMATGFAGDLPGFRGRFFKGGAVASDQEAAEFIDKLRSRYGEFVSCHPVKAEPPPFGKAQMLGIYVMEFDRARLTAEAELVFADPNTGEFVFRLGSITVVDEQQGNLSFPPQPAEPRPATGRPGDGG